MTQKDDRSKIEETARLYEERQERSRLLLAKIDQLDAKIAAAGNQKALRAALKRESAKTRRQFAEHLGELGYIEKPSWRSAMAIWLVRGVPSKKHKEQARAWMEQLGKDWDGSAPSLRHEVKKALEQNKSVPEHKFGLHVERTVDIKMPRSFTVNLLGKPHHIVASATEPTNAEMKEEKALRKFLQGEN